MNYLEKPYQCTDDYDLFHYDGKSFELDVNYTDGWADRSVTIDALEVYKHLKDYFKGTLYE